MVETTTGPVRAQYFFVQEENEDKKRRYIAFVGNLSFGVTREDLEAHFKPAGLRCIGLAVNFSGFPCARVLQVR